MKFLKTWIQFFAGGLALKSNGTPSDKDVPEDTATIYTDDFDGSGTATIFVKSEDGKVVKLGQGSALTADVVGAATISKAAPGSADYAFQASVASGGHMFASENEANSLIYLVVNLQARVKELESRLEASGMISS